MDQIQQDQYHGVGGSYRVDPRTGIRTRVEGPSLADDVQPNPHHDGSTLPGVGTVADPGAVESDASIDQPGRNGRKAKE